MSKKRARLLDLGIVCAMDLNFMPSHIDVSREDLRTEQVGGRLFFLPGSPDRARRIAERFDEIRALEIALAAAAGML